MDDTAWPSVPWTEYLNGDFEDEDSYASVYDAIWQNQGNVEPNEDKLYQTTQSIDTAPAATTRGGQSEECFFPHDVEFASDPQIHFPGLTAIKDVDSNPDQGLACASAEKPSNAPPRKTRQVFSTEARRMVREWLSYHSDDPYPTTAEKKRFAQSLNLSVKQISTLFNNMRIRHVPVNTTPTKPSFASLSPFAIATLPEIDKDDTPMSRYLSSSPEEDPQPMEVVAEAAANYSTKLGLCDALQPAVQPPSQAKKKRRLFGPQNGGGSEISSRSDVCSSHTSEQSGSGSSCASGKKGKRRTTTARPSTTMKGRYYCTYCWKNFASSSSWRKHEETLHMPQKAIECRMSDLKPTLTDCGACLGAEAGCTQRLNHNYKACLGRTKEVRTFYRTDHFKSHIANIHNATFTPAMEHWVQPTSNNPKSRCGFCLKWFPTWTERLDHIGVHYRFHDHFDKSKWQLGGEEEQETVEAATPAKTYEGGKESSALVKHQGQPGLQYEINSFLKDFLAKRYSPTLLGNDELVVEWEHLGLREIRALDVSRTIVIADRAGIHHHLDCPVVTGGDCKFDLIQGSQ